MTDNLIGYFNTFNNDYPVLNQDVFNSYFERQYSTDPPSSSAWYALFNAVLSLGSIRNTAERERHVRGSRLVDYTSATHEVGVGYFRNASSCFNDLFFGEASVMSMQAVTLMVCSPIYSKRKSSERINRSLLRPQVPTLRLPML